MQTLCQFDSKTGLIFFKYCSDEF